MYNLGLTPRASFSKLGRIDRKTLELLLLDLIQKGYRIKEEILVEFLKNIGN